MKKSRVIILIIIILVVFSALAFFSYSSGTYKDKIKDFAVKDTATVTRIFLANKFNNTVLLEREPFGGVWTLNKTHEASKSLVNLFLETILRIRVKNPVPQKSIDFIFTRMSANAVKVEIYEQCYRIDFWGIKWFPHEKMTKCYYVGDPTQDNLGTFMLMDGAETPFVVYLPGFRGFVSSRYLVSEQDWRSRKMFNFNAQDIKSVSLEYPDQPENSFSVGVDEIGKIHFNTFETIYQPKTVDTLKIVNFLNSFKNISCESILNYSMDSLRMDSIIQTAPERILTITPKNGETLILKTFPMISDINNINENTGQPVKNLDNFYIYTDKGDFLTAQYFVFDKILRKRNYFCFN